MIAIKRIAWIVCFALTHSSYARRTAGNTTKLTSTGQTNSTGIGQSDISAGKTRTISTPGNYHVTRHLTYVPDAASDTMINITSDNVSLNLSTFALYSDRSQTGTVAINIAAGVANVTIYNGTIRDFTGIGIQIGSGCRNIHIADLFVENCDEGGISASSADHCYIENCVINSCNGSSSTADGAAFRLTSCKHIVANQCEFSLTTASGKAGIGAKLSGCVGCQFTDCFANHSSGTAAYGFQLASSCKDCSFTNCGAANNTSSAGECLGFDIDASPTNRFMSCYANNNVAAGGQASGFNFTSTSDANELEDCRALDNSGDGAVYGFLFSDNNGNQLLNCRSSENSTTGGSAVGFRFSNSDGNSATRCSATHNASSGTGSAYGFQLVSACQTNWFGWCHASLNTTSVADQVAAGFYSNGGNGNTFQNCTANGQVASGAGTSAAQYGAGFVFDGTETASSLIECRADRNSGGSSGSGVGFGIYLRSGSDLTSSSTSAPSSTTIRNCTVSFNTGPANKYGVFDQHSDSTSVMVNNVSVGHGRCVSTLDTSFNFTDPATGMNFMFFHTGTDENPANIIHETDIFNWTTISTKTDWHNVSVVTDQVTTV